jgi:hypothetical protein
MVEYHGWLTLRAATQDVDDDRLGVLAASVRKQIDQGNADNRVIGIRVVNANYMLWYAGCTNHWSTELDDIFDLLKSIATEAPGSYGLLYLWDDEDFQHENEFRVWKLAKGVLTEEQDPFLSPCVPMIEDSENDSEKSRPE